MSLKATKIQYNRAHNKKVMRCDYYLLQAGDISGMASMVEQGSSMDNSLNDKDVPGTSVRYTTHVLV